MKRSLLIILFCVVLFGIFSTFVSGQGCTDNNTIFRINNPTNAHAALWNQTSYNEEICFDKYFRGSVSSALRSCGGDNTVLRISDIINAHAEDPYPIPPLYTTRVCYEDLNCQLKSSSQSCQSDGTRIIFLSSTTNAHLTLGTSSYQYKLCCASETAEPFCNYNGTCDPPDETSQNCDDCNGEGLPTGLTPVFSFDYQPVTGYLQSGWTEVLPEVYNPAKGFGWTPGTTVQGVVGPEIPGDPLSNATRDYHKVSSSKFSALVNSSVALKYFITIYSGSSSEASGPFDIIVEAGTSNEKIIATGVQTTAGSFAVTTGNVTVSDNFLNVTFQHTNPIAISGLVLSSYCGDGVINNPEECDDGNHNNFDSCPDGEGGTCRPATCGDYFIQSGVEVCDPPTTGGACTTSEGYAGTGGCAANCLSYNCTATEWCGDGIIQSAAGEKCEDTDLDGETCESLGAGIGNLSCLSPGDPNECKFNMTNCTSPPSAGEWCNENEPFLYEHNGSYYAPNSCRDYNLVNPNNLTFSRLLCINDCIIGASDPANNGYAGQSLIDYGCAWNGTWCFFYANMSDTTQCRIDYLSMGDCGADDAFREVIVNGTQIAGTDPCDVGCGGGIACETQIPCPKVVQLSFFTMITAILSIILIAFVYWIKKKK